MKLKKKYLIIALGFLVIFAIAMIAYPKQIRIDAVPFGLKAGTKIPVGEKAKFPATPASAEADLHRANDLLMVGSFQTAHDNYETILLKYPNLPAALFGKAYSIIVDDSISAEKTAKTKSLIENLAQQMPGSIWVQLLLTFTQERDGNIGNALKMAAELAAKSPAFSEARLRYADLLFKAGQPAIAAEEAKAAISLSYGADARAYIVLAFALHKMGSLEECAELVNYALPRFPSQTGFLLLSGYLNEYARDFDKAQNDYRRILALKPRDISALQAMATLGEKIPPSGGVTISASGLSILRDQAKETAKIILPLIEEYPENLPLREAMGRIYLRARLMKEARQQFSEIYSQDFEYPNIRRLIDESVEEQTKFVPPPPQNNKNLADSLAKTFASLRLRENSEYDDLGRYLVHYGATFKEFFSKYSITRFKKLSDREFAEKYKINSIVLLNTIFFDANKSFYAVRSIISDSTSSDSPDYIPDLFRHLVRKEAGTLGEGVPIEPVLCYDEKWEGFVWTSRDNFEVLLQGAKDPRTVYIIRLHAKRFSDTGNLCSYVSMALDKSKTPSR